MRHLTATTDPQTMIGQYGPDFEDRGLISEHVDVFEAAGGTFRVTGSGRTWAVLPDGRAYPVLCSDLIEVWTEDGRMTGRCGAPTVRDGSCEGHAAERDAWRDDAAYWASSQSDADYYAATGA